MAFKHYFDFSMGKIDCSLPEQDVVNMMQLLIDHAYMGNRVAVVKYFKVLDDDNCEFSIERYLTTDYCLACGPQFIGEHDESLLSGLETPYFSLKWGPTATITPVVAPLIPMGSAFYTPMTSFTTFWKRINEKYAGEKIQRITIDITTTALTVRVKYARTVTGNQKRYADDIHDLEMEIGDSLTNHRGETFEWPLQELGEICARKYLKRKSYDGLIGYLKKEFDIDLKIKDY